MPMVDAGSNSRDAGGAPPPLWLLAELTYRCPLHCAYCSNPLDYATHGQEIDTATWRRVLAQARELGAAQLGFSGGEPLMRDDLAQLVAHARELGYYTNLITSGVGLNETRIAQLHEAGLDHIQLSFQDATAEYNNTFGRAKSWEHKRRAAALIKQFGFPMVFNVVLHRQNIDHIETILEFALELGAEYVELANTQYYGWAHLNRAQLLPTREQLARAEAATEAFRARVGSRMRLYFVVPDYYADRPKACMSGWGNVFMAIAPDGVALPCHSARMLPGIEFPNVREHSLHDIWYASDAFNRFRGEAWMKDPCRTCPERGRDFGGCRCQAYLFTQDAANADPVCALSPHRDRVDAAIAQAHSAATVAPIVFRDDRASRAQAKPAEASA